MRIFFLIVVIILITYSIDLTIPIRLEQTTKSENIKSQYPTAAYERQQFFVDKRLPLGQDYLPMDVYKQASLQIQSLNQFSTKTGAAINKNLDKSEKAVSNWEWLGPGNIGGRTRSLVFHPQNSNIMYASGVSGGIWKTETAGQLWRPIADNMANINVGVVAIDPIKPSTIYAGTGELYRKTLRPYSSMSGAGIFKSTDDGETWLQLQSTINSNFLYVSDLIISPNNHQRIYAATNTGVWRSNNGGISFEHSLFPNDGLGNELYEGCNDLSIREDVFEDWLLVSCSSRSTDDRYYLPGLLPDACNGPCDARIYLNTQAQESDEWNVVLSEPGMGRTQMSIHKANQSIIYASSANTDGGPDFNGDLRADLQNGLHAIFRSNDGGVSWQPTLRNTDPTLLNTQLFSYAEGTLGQYCGWENSYYSAGWYNQAIAVSPTDPDVLWVAGMEIYRSDDGGHNFGMASQWDAIYYPDPNVHGSYVHADQHSLIFHPDYDGVNNKSLYSTNDGGVYFTDDDSQRVIYGNDAACYPPSDGVQWQSLNHNYGVTQFYTGAVFPNGQKYIAGAQDNGTIVGQDATGANAWYEIVGGDGSELAINPSNLNNWYASWQRANILRTMDAGVTWTSIRDGLTGNFIFITPFNIDPNNSNRLFVGGQYLWRSDNKGESWQQVTSSLGFNYNDLISALAIAPGDSNKVLYANQHSIYAKPNALSSFGLNNFNESSPRTGWVSSLAFEPNNSQVAYATYSTFGGEHVWKSIDSGISWQSIDGEGAGKLPDIPVHSLVVDPNNIQRLYIGTDLGVFVSVDGGQNWLVENTGFSQVITERLAINQPTDGSTPYLFAFTYGRGVWRVPLADLDAQIDFSINSDISGLWYNQSQSGHGLQLEVIESNGEEKLYISWYAYLNGNPIWLTGVGDIQNNKVNIEVIITDNSGFPPDDFNSEDVIRQSWGSLALEFTDKDNGILSWSSILPEYSNGALSIQRLTSISDDLSNQGINACHSGTWYNINQSGHGFMAEVIDSSNGLNMILTWFTYLDGNQYWILANGPINGNTATLSAVAGFGGGFPPNFESDEVTLENWGRINFTIIDDNNAEIEWQSNLDNFNDASIQVSRLTTLLSHSCLN
jgi:hypothetical protein